MRLTDDASLEILYPDWTPAENADQPSPEALPNVAALMDRSILPESVFTANNKM